MGSLQEQNALLEKQRDLYRLHLLQRRRSLAAAGERADRSGGRGRQAEGMTVGRVMISVNSPPCERNPASSLQSMTLELAVSLPVWFHRSRCGRRRLSQRQDVRRRRKRFRWELDPVDTKCAENALRLQHSLHQHEDHLLKMASEVRFISFFHADDAVPPRGSVEFAAEPAAVAGTTLSRTRSCRSAPCFSLF